jgi:ketosteroid isomerase-like protein
MNRAVILITMCLLLVPATAFAVGPTEESAGAAEQEVAKALLANDADAVGRLLADDWVVVSTYGGMADREAFLSVIKSGQFSRKTMELSDFRVKLYGNTAVVTSKLHTSGMLMGKPFDVLERQTDVLVWKDGSWKSVLTHETQIREH